MAQKIAYQGEPGANSNIACMQMFPELESVPCASFEDAFELVAVGTADLAMIPIENSIAGRVADIHVLLPHSGLQIVGEYYLPIHFDLLGIPGSTIEAATEVHSHLHALGQCRRLIRSASLRPVIAGDTAGSAREVRDWNDPTKLSLAPPLAAQLYGLEVLASAVEDDPSNTTRFVVIANQEAAPSGRDKTSLVMSTRNVPGAIHELLTPLAANRVSMTRLESRPSRTGLWEYVFFLDMEGHQSDAHVARALEEMRGLAAFLKILGSYPAAVQ